MNIPAHDEARGARRRRDATAWHGANTIQTRSGGRLAVGAFAVIGTATVADRFLVPGAVSDLDRLTTTTATIDYSGTSPALSIGHARWRSAAVVISATVSRRE